MLGPMRIERFYPIGTPGRPWAQAEKDEWFAARERQRSYAEEVRSQLDDLDSRFSVERYGALSIDPERYPLFHVQAAAAGADAPWVFITGGVHGYETSGVQGALAFLRGPATEYLDRVNLVVAPCVSPWGYEVINRWNPRAIDPNRSFVTDSPAEESAAIVKLVAQLNVPFVMHLDLHETTDSDETEFRPALAARDGEAFEPGVIPDGFYLVADANNPEPEFQAAMIAAVEKVTHIAPPDPKGEIIGSKVTQPGVIQYPFDELGLCAGVTRARFCATTEVYPDSPQATPEICNAAQVAAIRGGLDHILER